MKTRVDETVIRETIIDVLAIVDNDLTDDTELIEYGLNSLKTIALIVKLEELYNITFDEDDLLFENFSTIRDIINQLYKLNQ